MQRESVLAAIEDDGAVFITDKLTHDAYHATQGQSAEDERHLGAIFCAPAAKGRARHGRARGGAPMEAAAAAGEETWDESSELEGATVVADSGGGAGGGGWKDRVKKAQALEKVAQDRRQQRLAQARAALAEPTSAGASAEVGRAGRGASSEGAEAEVKEAPREKVSFSIGGKR